MILRHVELRGVRCFRNPVRLGEFGDGINILFGPNECGKSTIIEAAARALFDRHSSNAAGIRELQPWGGDLTPQIRLEFEADEGRYELAKSFLKGAQSVLATWESGRFEPRWDGDSADQRLRDLMLSETPGNRASKPEQWGLARTLWAAQGRTGGSPLADRRADPLGVSDAVADQLRQALGGAPVSSVRGLMGERVRALYDTSYTETGIAKKGGELKSLLEEIAQLQADLEAAQQQYEQAQTWSGELDAIERELARLDAELTQRAEKAEALAEQAREVQQQKLQIEQTQKDAHDAREHSKTAARQVTEYREAEKAEGETRRQLEACDRQLREAEADREATRRLVREAREEGQEAEAAFKAAREALQTCRSVGRAQELLRDERELTDLAEQLDVLSASQAELEKAASKPFPTAKQVKRARELETETATLRARIEAAGVSLKVDLLADQTVTFEGGEEPREERAAAGETLEYASGQEASATIEGVARIRARSGAAEPARLAEELRDTQQELARSLTGFGAKDADDLDRLQAEGREARAEARRLEKRIAELAGEHKDVASVRTRLAAVANELDGLLRKLELMRETLETAKAGDEDELAREEAAADERRRDCADRLEDRRTDEEQAIDTEGKLQAEAGRLKGDLQGAAATMRTTLQNAACADFASLEQRATDAEAQAETLGALLAEQQAALPAPESDPENLLSTERRAIKDVEDSIRRQRDQASRLGGLLEQAQADGLHEARRELEEQVARRQEELGRELRRALGSKLLWRLFRDRREALGSGQLEDLESKVTRIFRAVTGANRAVGFSQDFSVEGIRPAEAAEARELDQFSSGAQEQLELIQRLALGEVYAEKHGRQMLVLDDVLVYTDPDRHDRVLQVLGRAAELLQVFILTSRPQLYRGLTDPRYEFAVHELARASV